MSSSPVPVQLIWCTIVPIAGTLFMNIIIFSLIYINELTSTQLNFHSVHFDVDGSVWREIETLQILLLCDPIRLRTHLDFDNFKLCVFDNQHMVH